MILSIRSNNYNDHYKLNEVDLGYLKRFIWMYDGGISSDYIMRHFENFGYYNLINDNLTFVDTDKFFEKCNIKSDLYIQLNKFEDSIKEIVTIHLRDKVIEELNK